MKESERDNNESSSSFLDFLDAEREIELEYFMPADLGYGGPPLGKEEREKERLKVHSETWPRLEPGTCPYMHTRLP